MHRLNRLEREFLLSSEQENGTTIGVNAGKISAEILMAIDGGEIDYRATQFAIVRLSEQMGVEVNGKEFDWIMQDVREQTKVKHPEWFTQSILMTTGGALIALLLTTTAAPLKLLFP